MAKLLIIALLFVLGCAEGGTPVTDEDMGSDDVGVNNVNNQNNVNNANNQNNMTNNACPVCCSGDKVCSDATTVGICRADGNGFNDAPCLNDQVCDNGICVDPPECMAGERSCFDDATVLVCRQSEDGFVSMPCEMGTTCYQGECLTGNPVGTACAMDDECLTSNCHCGSGTDEVCGSITQGYCSSDTCDADSCGRDAICVAANVIPLGDASADYNHCIPRCVGGCEAGFECIDIPSVTAEGVVWEQGCYFPGFVDIGAECANDGQCIGGACLTDVFNTNYCSRVCTDDGECPEGSACVNLKNDGQFYCSLLCGDGAVNGSSLCPLDVPTERFDVTCKVLGTVGGGVTRACAESN